MNKRATILSIFLIAFGCIALAIGPSIRVHGAWCVDIGPAQLMGDDPSHPILSPAGQVLMSVKAFSGAQAWRVDVHQEDAVWHPDLRLSVRRADDGSGAGRVSGGLRFVELGPADVPFVTGVGDKAGVGLQYALTGVSIALPPGEYSAQIVYTVVEP